MRTHASRAVGVLGLALALAGSAVRADAQQATDIDREKLAETLVTQNAGVQKDDIVVIWGMVQDLDLLENIAVQARKVGAHPMITIGSDRLTRRMFVDVPAEFDAQAPLLEQKLAEIVDVQIIVPTGGDDPNLLADIPPERFAARAKAFEPVNKMFLERAVRGVFLSNDMYPTAWRAERFGMSQDELSKTFWAAVQVDPTRLQETGQAIESMLEAGRTLRITHPNGTDLEMRIEGRRAYVSDGVVSEEDRKQGGAATTVWLPAGEVYVTPVPGTAEGTLVVDRTFFEGQEIRKAKLEIDDGKVTSMTAESGLERLQALYEAADPGKEVLAVVDIGINPNLEAPPDSKIETWIPAGMVTVGIGDNTWAGGENEVNFGWAGHLPGATLEVDGKKIVEDGRLRVEGMALGS